MTYCFRLRFKLGAWEQIVSDDQSWTLTSEEDGEHVTLFAGAERLRDAKALVVQGREYDDEETALEAGRRWRARISVAFARVGLGADFGDRTPSGAYTEYGLQQLERGARRGAVPQRPERSGGL